MYGIKEYGVNDLRPKAQKEKARGRAWHWFLQDVWGCAELCLAGEEPAGINRSQRSAVPAWDLQGNGKDLVTIQYECTCKTSKRKRGKKEDSDEQLRAKDGIEVKMCGKMAAFMKKHSQNYRVRVNVREVHHSHLLRETRALLPQNPLPAQTISKVTWVLCWLRPTLRASRLSRTMSLCRHLMSELAALSDVKRLQRGDGMSHLVGEDPCLGCIKAKCCALLSTHVQGLQLLNGVLDLSVPKTSRTPAGDGSVNLTCNPSIAIPRDIRGHSLVREHFWQPRLCLLRWIEIRYAVRLRC
eukprot:6379391-Amphidinium_carterae.2